MCPTYVLSCSALVYFRYCLTYEGLAPVTWPSNCPLPHFIAPSYMRLLPSSSPNSTVLCCIVLYCIVGALCLKRGIPYMQPTDRLFVNSNLPRSYSVEVFPWKIDLIDWRGGTRCDLSCFVDSSFDLLDRVSHG